MRLRLAFTLALWAVGSPLFAADFEPTDLRIPMAAAGPDGLEAVVVLPRGAGRHPLAILSHGSPREASDRPGMTARSMTPELVEFARRGFLAVSVLRRGYGSSQGGWAESFGPCRGANYVEAGRAGAADIRAAIVALSRREDVDPSRIVAVGVSAGGFATVALTADPPPGLVAAISFAGGRGSQGPDSVCDEDALVGAFRTFGERSRIPMLWVYAENDHFFAPPLARKLLDAFQRAGGRASFVAAPAYGTDGHSLFSAGGRPTWTPIVDSFLQRQGLSAPVVTSSLAPPRQLSPKGRADFQTYLAAAAHKAFAITPEGGYAWRTGRSTGREASEAAMSQCQQISGAACTLYAVDDEYAPAR